MMMNINNINGTEISIDSMIHLCYFAVTVVQTGGRPDGFQSAGEAQENATSRLKFLFFSLFKSHAFETRRREALLNSGEKSISAARRQPAHAKWVRGATAVKHYVFEVILRSFCALFKTLTSSYQRRRLPERQPNANGCEPRPCLWAPPCGLGLKFTGGAGRGNFALQK